MDISTAEVQRMHEVNSARMASIEGRQDKFADLLNTMNGTLQRIDERTKKYDELRNDVDELGGKMDELGADVNKAKGAGKLMGFLLGLAEAGHIIWTGHH